MKIRVIIIFLTYLLLNENLFSQNQLYTQSKKAIKLYNEAVKKYDESRYNECINLLQKAIKEDEQFIEAYLLMADNYILLNDIDKAIVNYKEAAKINKYYDPYTLYRLGNLYLMKCNYEEAKIAYEDFLKQPKIKEETKLKAEQMIKNCQFALEAKNNPVPFKPVNMGPSINSEEDEYFPAISPDGKMFLFTRSVRSDISASGTQEDFWISYNIDGKWENAKELGKPINTPFNEGAPSLAKDGRIMVFAACEIGRGGQYGPNREGAGSCDIFFSFRRRDGSWSSPRNIGPPINTRHFESQPSISSDGTTLYFISNRPGGQGKQDIWYTELDENGFWKEPVNLGPEINTPEREESVFIHPDNQTLYFASDGHVGMGGLDIYMCRRDSSGKWTKPINLGYPINTCGDENSFIVTPSGDKAIFASDRHGGYGKLDFYEFELYPQIRPLEITYFKGKVYDKETKEPLEAKFELIDLKTGRTITKSLSDRTTGEFFLCLPVNFDYLLNVSKKDYLFYSDNFFLSEKKGMLEPYQKDIPLHPIKIGESIILKNIFFETAKWELRPESLVELDKLYKFLINNKTLKVEISGHTDNVGDDKSNQILSEKRAKVVFDWLIAKGIDSSRLEYKGYGETKPIDTNETEEGRQNNRRTELKIIGK